MCYVLTSGKHIPLPRRPQVCWVFLRQGLGMWERCIKKTRKHKSEYETHVKQTVESQQNPSLLAARAFKLTLTWFSIKIICVSKHIYFTVILKCYNNLFLPDIKGMEMSQQMQEKKHQLKKKKKKNFKKKKRQKLMKKITRQLTR